MPIPEPLPEYLPEIDFSQLSSRFNNDQDLNGAVDYSIRTLASLGQYTGIGCVQNYLFTNFPHARMYLQQRRMHPDQIPAFVNHRRLIQRINSQFWAYAVTRAVITLRDLDELRIAECGESGNLLGPIFVLPVAQELFEVNAFHPNLIFEFTTTIGESLISSANELTYRVTSQYVLEELNQCVCKNRFRQSTSSNPRQINRWWEAVFTHHMLIHFRANGVPHNMDNFRVDSYHLDQLGQYGIRIKGFPKLIESITEMLKSENLARASKLAQDMLDVEVREVYRKFAENVISSQAINSLRQEKPLKALRSLARNSKNLFNQLNDWAVNKNLTWPSGYLDSLLKFHQFLNDIAASGPFRSLLHLALVYSNVEGIDEKLLLPRVGEVVIIDVDAEPECELAIDSGGGTSASEWNAQSLTDVVQLFNTFVKDVCLVNGSNKGIPWSSLLEFEQSLSKKTTLIALLAKACSTAGTNEPLIPKCLYAQPLLSSTSEDGSDGASFSTALNEVAGSSVEVQGPDIHLIRSFMLQITCLAERSAQMLLEIIGNELHVPRSPDTLHMVRCILTEAVSNLALTTSRLAYLVHPMEFFFIRTDFNPNSDITKISDITSNSVLPQELFTQRSAVLRLLASCPSMMDPEVWSLWSFPGFLVDRWGSLDEFILSCSGLEVCEKYNLVILRLTNGEGFLRLSANGSAQKLDKCLAACLQNTRLDSTATVRQLCDLLIGSSIQINRLGRSESIDLLVSRLKNDTDPSIWSRVVLDVMICVPPSLLGLVFSKLLVPSLDMSGCRKEDNWSLDKKEYKSSSSDHLTGLLDLLLSTYTSPSQNQYHRLITAIGAVGAQLGWPAWLECYALRRVIIVEAAVAATEETICEDVQAPPERSLGGLPLLFENEELEVRTEETPPHSCKPLPSAEQILVTVQSERVVDDVTVAEEDVLGRREFINQLRQTEFGHGITLDDQASRLLQRFEGRLSRSLSHLSHELYGQPGHFLLELIQNADDNSYQEGIRSSVEFCLIESTENKGTLYVRNNEAVGFTEADMSALCDVGVSTKVFQRDEKIGRKGIGFKSVFSVTNAPEVHSSGFHVRFQRTLSAESQSNLGSILVPHWTSDQLPSVPVASASDKGDVIKVLSTNLTPSDAWKTVFKLPLTGENPATSPKGVANFANNLLSPHIMLFLRRLQILQFSYCNENSSVFNYKRLEKTSRRLFTSSEACLDLLTVVETTMQRNKNIQQKKSSKWLVFTCNFKVIMDHLANLGSTNRALPNQTNITIGIPLSDIFPLPKYPVYAYLPVRSAGFHFLLNGDFDLTSSREDVDGTSVWNQWLVTQIPYVFESLLKSIVQVSSSCLNALKDIELSQTSAIARILDCLPVAAASSTVPGERQRMHSTGRPLLTSSIFACLSEQLRDRLSSLAWIPVVERKAMEKKQPLFTKPNKVLLILRTLLQSRKTSETLDKQGENSSDDFLTGLLIERLGMQELDAEFAWSTTDSNEKQLVEEDTCQTERRLEKLIRLGAQTVSADSLVELASNLSGEELKRPGVLLAILGNIDASLRGSSVGGDALRQSALQAACTNRIKWCQRISQVLRKLPIFPLTDGRIVSLALIGDRMMLPPPPLRRNSVTDDAVYDALVDLLSRLGPMIAPSAIYPSRDPVTLPRLLTDSIENNGLDLRIGYPSEVFHTWILPHLQNASTIKNDWCLAAAQLTVWCLGQQEIRTNIPLDPNSSMISIDNEMLSIACRLPILVGDGSRQLSPVLATEGGVRETPAFVPLCLLDGENGDKLEFDLMTMCSDEALVATDAYFTGADELHLGDSFLHKHWLNLFMQAGLSTLKSVHARQYRTGDLPSHLAHLSVNHELSKQVQKTVHAINQVSATHRLIVEDFVCPGLESLLLPWIRRSANMAVSKPRAVLACQKLAGLLHQNWNYFENSTTVVYYEHIETGSQLTNKSTRRRNLCASTWLRHLRISEWLTVADSRPDGCDVSLMAAIDLHQDEPGCDADLIPSNSARVYSPSVFSAKQLGEVGDLLASHCPVWQPGEFLESVSPAPGLVESLGLQSRLDEAAFKHLMESLARSSSESLFAPYQLKPGLMCKIYHLALQLLTPSVYPSLLTSTLNSASLSASSTVAPGEKLRQLFAFANCRTILVPCRQNSKFEGRKKRRVGDASDRTTEAAEIEACSICTHLRTSASLPVGEGSRKRMHRVEEMTKDVANQRYHLVPIEWTCWQAVCLPSVMRNTEEDQRHSRDIDELEDDETICTIEPFAVVSGSSNDVSLPTSRSPAFSRIPLCDVYDSDWKTFFCDTLKAPSTSSIEEVLSLRPEPPVASNLRSQTYFGRQLSIWYALIDYCLSKEDAREMECVTSYRLLYDMSGRWHSPKEMMTRNRLLAWTSSDIASLFIKATSSPSLSAPVSPGLSLLGHSLSTLEASASSPIDMHWGHATSSTPYMGCSHAFLLDTLRLSVLDKCVTFSVGLFEVKNEMGTVAGFAAPSPTLKVAVDGFVDLTRAWFASLKHRSSIEKPTTFVWHKCVEAYMIPDLCLNMSLPCLTSSTNIGGESPQWTVHDVSCRLVDNKLYVDSRFEMALLAKHEESSSTLHSFCSSLLLSSDPPASTQLPLLAELTRAAFPNNKSIQMRLAHFIRGFLNIATSVIAMPPAKTMSECELQRSQLKAYLLSHGILRTSAATLVTALLPAPVNPSDVNPQVRPTDLTEPTSRQAAKLKLPAPFSHRNTSQHRSAPVNTATYGIGQGTRHHTILSEEFNYRQAPAVGYPALESVPLQLRMSASSMNSINDSSQSFSSGWNEATVTSGTIDRLQRMLQSDQGVEYRPNALVGRLGEQAVYYYLQEMVSNHTASFPSGHPQLDCGRLVDVQWLNGDAESRLPYDLTVKLQVECDETRWDSVLESLTSDIVQVERRPRSASEPGVLNLGPIFIEVKSTRKTTVDGSLDLFEISLNEAVCAQETGWRYHLIRVHNGSSGPLLTHIPNLSDALVRSADSIRLCVAMTKNSSNINT